MTTSEDIHPVRRNAPRPVKLFFSLRRSFGERLVVLGYRAKLLPVGVFGDGTGTAPCVSMVGIVGSILRRREVLVLLEGRPCGSLRWLKRILHPVEAFSCCNFDGFDSVPSLHES